MTLSTLLHCLTSAITKGYKVDDQMTIEQN